MVLCGSGLLSFWCALLLARWVLAQGGDGVFSSAAGPSSLPETTPEMGIISKLYNAARALVWRDSSNGTASRLQTPPSPTVAGQPDEGHFLQVEHGATVNFSLRVLNEDFSVASDPEVYLEGSTIHVEASVQASPGVFPKLFVEECYGADAPHQSHVRRIYIIADNHGCLHSRDPELTWFRKTDSTIVFTLPAFLMTGESDEIYIHCLLTAWSHRLPTSPGKKMCILDSTTFRWKNLDEPSKTSVCHCCDSSCHLEAPPHGSVKAEFPGEGRSHRKVIGPLRVRKDVPWFEGRCHTMKKMLLVSVAFVCSCILAALFVGVLVALVLAVLRYSCAKGGRRRLRTRKEQPFHTELQTVVGACGTEDAEKESNLDYCKLNDAPDKA